LSNVQFSHLRHPLYNLPSRYYPARFGIFELDTFPNGDIAIPEVTKAKLRTGAKTARLVVQHPEAFWLLRVAHVPGCQVAPVAPLSPAIIAEMGMAPGVRFD